MTSRGCFVSVRQSSCMQPSLYVQDQQPKRPQPFQQFPVHIGKTTAEVSSNKQFFSTKGNLLSRVLSDL
ncbi:hypothetical protein G7K_0421-t1 [Saitoella complicata NRRL Y-17804]|uniref:Uncharacterized protein n=1 Tax=Saitoella complicata (strain BCRC 22490 / CBS 7301 / JCM 7358 / NBRC 10748 / NRRL Y-17804) TaxID=698492 RepID=A0A0E9N8N6_SAICN|nr:hypothetical protein G7K_0421-t1 [Saitoella complicata NRRL Y-17804]